MKIIDLYCGIGGLSLGFKQAGFDLALALDIDKWAIETYNHNLGEGKIIAQQRDLNLISGNEILSMANIENEEFGVITGPPCQGFSLANSFREQDISKNLQYNRAIELIEEMQPEFFVIENVPGITSINGSNFYKDAMKKLNSTEFKIFEPEPILNSVDYGVPQKRKRVIITGSKSVINLDLNKNTQMITVEDAISDLSGVFTGEGEEEQEYPKSVILTKYQKEMRLESNRLYNHIISVNGKIVKERYSKIPEGKRLIDVMDNLEERLKIKVQFGNVYWRFTRDKPAPTIAHPRKSMYIHYEHDRGYSVREIARLQSLPDWFRFLGPKNAQQQHVADVVPPLLAKVVAEGINRNLN